MRLQAEESVDDVDAALLERPRPDDVRLLVEPRLQLDDRGNLLTGLGRARERLHDWRVSAGSVQRLLYRQHVGIVGGARDELDHGVERLVRLLEEDIPLADGVEDVLGVMELGLGERSEGLIAEVAAVFARGDLHQVGDVEHARGVIDVALGIELERLDQLCERRCRRLARDLKPHGVAALSPPELLLDCLEEVLALLLVDLEVEVSRDPEDVDAF